jgi:hypothetical protein
MVATSLAFFKIPEKRRHCNGLSLKSFRQFSTMGQKVAHFRATEAALADIYEKVNVEGE